MQSLLDRLLALPEPCLGRAEKIDYDALGFTPADAGALARVMRGDDEDPDEEWDQARRDASLHAARILAKVGGIEYFDTFLGQWHLASLQEDDGYLDEFPRLMNEIGEEAIAPLESILRDDSRHIDIRDSAADALGLIAENEHNRPGIMETFVACLAERQPTRTLNAGLVCFLMDWKAVDHIDLVRTLFAENLLDVSFCGDLEDVEIEFGLRTERETERPNLSELEDELAQDARRTELGPLPDSPDRLDLLAYLLYVYRNERSLTSVSQLEGLLVGCIVSPALILPSQFMPFIWDMEEGNSERQPVWESPEEMQLFFGALMETHNEIVNALQQGKYLPVAELLTDEEGELKILAPWAIGLLVGCSIWEDAEGIGDDPSHEIAGGAVELIQLESDPAENDQAQRDCLLQLLVNIHEAYFDHRAPMSGALAGADPGSPRRFSGPLDPLRREYPKIGRNDPCPCGSGKKFKKCCLNNLN